MPASKTLGVTNHREIIERMYVSHSLQHAIAQVGGGVQNVGYLALDQLRRPCAGPDQLAVRRFDCPIRLPIREVLHRPGQFHYVGSVLQAGHGCKQTVDIAADPGTRGVKWIGINNDFHRIAFRPVRPARCPLPCSASTRPLPGWPRRRKSLGRKQTRHHKPPRTRES